MSIPKLMGTIPGLLTAALIATATATPAAAQGGVELTPWAGVYIPTSNSVGALDQDIERDVSVAGGARLTFWGSGRLGFEATGGYAPAKIGDETINETGNTDLLLASGRLLLALSPVNSSVGFYLAGGPALLARGSNPFDDDRSSTDIGGVLGLGFRFGGGDDNRVGFRVDLEDYLYNGDFGGGDDFQNDLVASLGVSIALGGKASED
jgi:Outer membrane protein beta-barrel domain